MSKWLLEFHSPDWHNLSSKWSFRPVAAADTWRLFFIPTGIMMGGGKRLFFSLLNTFCFSLWWSVCSVKLFTSKTLAQTWTSWCGLSIRSFHQPWQIGQQVSHLVLLQSPPALLNVYVNKQNTSKKTFSLRLVLGDSCDVASFGFKVFLSTSAME